PPSTETSPLSLHDALPILLVDRDHRHDQAVLGEMAPIAQHFVADLAGPGIVDQHAADRRLAGDASARRVEDDDIAVFSQEDLGRSEEHTSELQSLAYLVCR